MYAYLKGELEGVSEDGVIIEVNGIGYNVKLSKEVITKLPPLHYKMQIFTYTSVREDALQLYGFLSLGELELFKKLITVNGIGPKVAQGLLAVMDVDTLKFAIMAGDAKLIAKAPGIGAKTAKKLILELKDKFHLEDALDEIAEPVKAVQRGSTEMNDAHVEAVQALVALGYSNSDALKAVKLANTGAEMNTEALLKAALKQLAFL